MKIHPIDAGKEKSFVRWGGVANLPSDDLRAAIRAGLLPERSLSRADLFKRGAQRLLGKAPEHDPIEGWFFDVRPGDGQIILHQRPNLVVDNGVYTSLERLAGINGPPAALSRMGWDNGTVNPAAATALSADGNSTTRTLAPFDSTPVRGSGATAKQLTFVRTFTDNAGTVPDSLGRCNFVLKRLFLTRHTANITSAATADTSGTLYSMTNAGTIDYNAISATWSATFSALLTGAGT